MGKTFEDKVEIEGAIVVRETEKALQVRANWDVGIQRLEWVPKSQIDDDSEVWKLGQMGTLIVSRWWAVKAGVV